MFTTILVEPAAVCLAFDLVLIDINSNKLCEITFDIRWDIMVFANKACVRGFIPLVDM